MGTTGTPVWGTNGPPVGGLSGRGFGAVGEVVWLRLQSGVPCVFLRAAAESQFHRLSAAAGREADGTSVL